MRWILVALAGLSCAGCLSHQVSIEPIQLKVDITMHEDAPASPPKDAATSGRPARR